MPRPRVQDTHEDEPRGSRRRDKHVYDHDEDDQPEYEHEERSRRTKSDKRPKPRNVSEVEEDEDDEDEDEDEDEEDEDEDDQLQKKQLVVHKKSRKPKSSRKEVARKKGDDSSDESSEEETTRKGKKKKKSKSREEETIRIDKWELVHRSEVDPDFVQLVADELGHHVNKILEGIEKDYLRRHTQTGLYNIDRFFKNHMFGKLDKQNWERVVKKCMANPYLKKALFCSAKTGEELFLVPSMAPTGRRGDVYGVPSMAPRGRRGDMYGGPSMIEYDYGRPDMSHSYYEPRCRECRDFDGPCGRYMG
ncbi:MAG: hypothetical protein Q9178_004388 [Gyalolechia marmorata]